MKDSFKVQILTSLSLFLIFVFVGVLSQPSTFARFGRMVRATVLAGTTCPADLEVYGILFYRPQTTQQFSPQAGDRVTAFGQLRNNGCKDTGVFNVKWFQDNQQTGYGSHSSMAPGEVSVGNVRYDFTMPNNSTSLVFSADVDNFIEESSKSNNSYGASISPTAPSTSLPDLTVSLIRIVRPQTNTDFLPAAGERATALAVLSNVGTQTTGYFNVKWFQNGAQVGYGSHSPLAPGETSTGNVRYDFTVTAGTTNLQFVADSDNFLTETSKNNNSYTFAYTPPVSQSQPNQTPSTPTNTTTQTSQTTQTQQSSQTTVSTPPVPAPSGIESSGQATGSQQTVTQTQAPVSLSKFELLFPKNEDALGAVGDIRWKVVSEPVTLSLYYSRDGVDWKEIATDVPDNGLYKWDTHTVPEGNYKILTLVKGSSTIRKESEQFIIDRTPPSEFNLASPGPDAQVGANPSFSWKESSDAISGFSRFSVLVDYKVVAESITTTRFDMPAEKGLTQGVHSWYVVSYDKAGNPRSSTARSFTVSGGVTTTTTSGSMPTLPELIENPKEIMRPISAGLEQAKIVHEEVKSAVQESQPVGQGLATGGAAVGLLSMVAGFSEHAAFPLLRGFTLSDFFALPHRIIALLLGLISRKKREEKPWGVIYDSVTKLPVDPAIVSLLDKDGKEIDSKITDYDGRFGFLVSPGAYTLKVKKTHYSFPSSLVLGNSDEFYPNLYHGETLTTEKNGVLNVNIPIDPIGFDWNQVVKPKYIGSVVQQGFLKFGDLFFYLGFFITLVWTFYEPSLTNLLFFALFISIFALKFFVFRPRAYGIIKILDGNPLAYALVKVFSKESGVRVASTVSDSMGRYFLLMPYPGVYYYTIEIKEEAAGPYREIYRSSTMPVLKKDSAVLNEVITI